MNLPNHLNETLVYNNYGSNATQAPSRRESLDYNSPQSSTSNVQNGSNVPYESTSETPNYYHHLSSNEKFEFLKSLSVSFPSTSYSMNHLLPSTSGHPYLRDNLAGTVKSEFSGHERGSHGAANGYGGVGAMYNEEVDVKPAYQTLEGYNLKHMDSALFSNSPMQNNTSSYTMQGSTQQSLAQKLVLAKINGSKYQVTSKPGRKRGKGAIKTDQVQQQDLATSSEYRVVHQSNASLANYRVVKHEEAEDEDDDSDGSERLVVEPEYTPRTPHSASEFDRSQFEKTFQNYSMTTTPSRGKPVNGAAGGGPIKKFPCDKCPKSFTLKQNLTYHVNSIHLGVRIQCDLCAKSFAHKPNLIAHMASAHNGVRFKCDHCVKSFNQKPNLISHIKSVHEGIKYKCEECTKTFAQKQNLLSHVQAIHMGIKYTCEVCSKSYNQVTNLLSHMSTVHQAQKYKCAECGRLFAQEHTLRSHTLSVHAGTRFTCRTCGDLFDSKRDLTEHVTEHHPGVNVVRETRGRPRKVNAAAVGVSGAAMPVSSSVAGSECSMSRVGEEREDDVNMREGESEKERESE
uniref:Zinc finger protein 1 homolog n=1 Tax=Cacopsylla melanoneura TaxID=428564 RepID=A0A8D8ZT02_9HEMI